MQTETEHDWNAIKPIHCQNQKLQVFSFMFDPAIHIFTARTSSHKETKATKEKKEK